MFSLRKITLAMLVLGSNAALAGTMGAACTPGNVTVPCATSGWDAGIYALYLKHSYSGDPRYFNYRGSEISGGQRRPFAVNADFDWGFKLEGSYHFNTGNDVNVNWYHWKNTNSQDIHYFSETSGAEVFATPHQINQQWDAVNFEFGQHVDFGASKNIRFHGGAQYARLQFKKYSPYLMNIPAFYTINSVGAIELVPAETVTGADRVQLTFNGVGPRIGADMSYDWSNGFSIYANGAAALLVGSNKINDTSDIEPNQSSYTAIVPEMEAKLGLAYAYAMTQGNLTLDGGYMVANYWDAFHLVQASINGTTNFGVYGPYLGLKYVGAL